MQRIALDNRSAAKLQSLIGRLGDDPVTVLAFEQLVLVHAESDSDTRRFILTHREWRLKVEHGGRGWRYWLDGNPIWFRAWLNRYWS